MVLLATCVLGSLLALPGLASPAAWLQHNDPEGKLHVRTEETFVEQPFSNRPVIPRATDSGSCTVDSFANITNFILREYLFESVGGAGDTAQLRGTLTVENPGSNDTYRLYRIPLSTGGGVWSGCRAGEEAPLPEQLARCQYVLERRISRIGFRFQWYCNDKDPNRQYAKYPCSCLKAPSQEKRSN